MTVHDGRPDVGHHRDPAALTVRQRSDIVLALARNLHVNGQSTSETIAAAERIGRGLGLRARLFPGWAQIELRVEAADDRVVSVAAAEPTGVNMDRVALAMQHCRFGSLAASNDVDALLPLESAPQTPTLLLTLACASGAAALSVIFGVQHASAVLLIAVSAALGAILRRALAGCSTNPLLQPFAAAFIAGIIGGLAVRYHASSTLRLITVCPCMILVPGPHVLNGMMDLTAGRISLGASRLVFAGTVVVAICAGLLAGLSMLGVSLPADAPSRPVPLGLDIIAAGVAVAAYSIFFSTPLRMLGWPVVVGMIGHGLRWWTLAVLGAGTPAGALAACAVVGLILTPVARRNQFPFAAIGFASVVSLIPGVYLFRLAGGLLELANGNNTTLHLLSATFADGLTAIFIILAMSFGLLVPKIIIDRLAARAAL
jgi:uncharacterized membrane protein YjjP (DUF1212 family)